MNDSIKILMAERDKLISQKEAMIQEFDYKINSLEDSIEKLSGGKIEFNNLGEVKYDDESPDYIKQSLEEI